VFNHIVGLLKPDEGTILFQGKPLKNEVLKSSEGLQAELTGLFFANELTG